MNKIFAILLFLVYSLFAIDPLTLESGKTDIKISPDSKWLIYDQTEDPGLYLLNLTTDEAVKIASGPGIAKYASWSPDGQFIGFKMFRESFQIPCLFDVNDSRIIALHPPVALSGVPSIDRNGDVVFTVGEELLLTDIDGNISKKFSLPAYSNLTPISFDGQFVVFNDQYDRLHLLNLKNGERKLISRDDKNYYNPRWNPSRLLVSFQGFDGSIRIFEPESDGSIEIGAGINPQWSTDGNYLLFTRQNVVETRDVLTSDIYMFNRQTKTTVLLTETIDKFENYPALSNKGELFYVVQNGPEKGVFKMKILDPQTGRLNLNSVEIPVQIQKISPIKAPEFDTGYKSENSYSFSFEIPFVHQVFDPPAWFDGHWACGGTAAIMCIAYYDILPKIVRNVSKPMFHTTAYGDYIAEKYTYNGFTFDIWATDSKGVKGYGAYGFIVRNGDQAWADTKGFMAEYARKHGLFSYVDWKPTRQKLMSEADAERPFTLLNSLTQAGHYISVIGYEKQATTVIVNDPYGNKNKGNYGKNYAGKGAKYDWPGYSNGHYNLNTVWCFIYFRDKSADLVPVVTAQTDTLQMNQTYPMKIQISNQGNQLSDSTKMLLFLSQNAEYNEGLDKTLDTLTVSAIQPGDTLQIDFSFTLSDSMVSGNYYFGAFVKVVNRDNEANPENNTWTKKLPLKGYPNIFRASPRGNIKDAMPVIKAYFIDIYSGIDSGDIKMFVDSVDVSSQCTVTATSVSYLPDKELSAGAHSVRVEVSNSLGLRSAYAWEFNVETQTAIEDYASGKLPKNLTLLPNYPNPFNGWTIIRYILPKSAAVKAELYNLQGQSVKIILNGYQNAGRHQLRLHARNLASGIYLLRLQAGREVKVRRILLIK
ncbi:MAG: T9SS type A sorting domain-containing protein [Calditrichaeota bacterium]|nr:T9SS type A sorting domain-containing protein [Calditrichota bacterium]